MDKKSNCFFKIHLRFFMFLELNIYMGKKIEAVKNKGIRLGKKSV